MLSLTNWKPVQRTHFILFGAQLNLRLSPYLWCMETFEIVEICLPLVINIIIVYLLKVQLRVRTMSSVRIVAPIFISHLVLNDNFFTV